MLASRKKGDGLLFGSPLLAVFGAGPSPPRSRNPALKIGVPHSIRTIHGPRTSSATCPATTCDPIYSPGARSTRATTSRRPDDIKKLVDSGCDRGSTASATTTSSWPDAQGIGGNKKVVIIRPKRDDAAASRGARQQPSNSHTFILVHQRHPADLRDPERRSRRLRPPRRRRTAAQRRRGMARRLRLIKSTAAAAARRGQDSPRVVTVHDGYGYLLQEFGPWKWPGVIQPAHGLTPVGRRAPGHGQAAAGARKIVGVGVQRRGRFPAADV